MSFVSSCNPRPYYSFQAGRDPRGRGFRPVNSDRWRATKYNRCKEQPMAIPLDLTPAQEERLRNQAQLLLVSPW